MSISENASGQKKLGRPRKEEIYGGHIRCAENFIASRLPELVENLFALAGGVWMEETTKEGKRIVYKERPDRASNEYLLNRIMGKPVESITLNSDDPDDEPKRIALPRRRKLPADTSSNGSH